MTIAVSFASLKSHVIAFVQKEASGLDASYHALVHRFVTWAETEETAIREAVAKLLQHGYTVTAPVAPVAPAEPPVLTNVVQP